MIKKQDHSIIFGQLNRCYKKKKIQSIEFVFSIKMPTMVVFDGLKHVDWQNKGSRCCRAHFGCLLYFLLMVISSHVCLYAISDKENNIGLLWYPEVEALCQCLILYDETFKARWILKVVFENQTKEPPPQQSREIVPCTANYTLYQSEQRKPKITCNFISAFLYF